MGQKLHCVSQARSENPRLQRATIGQIVHQVEDPNATTLLARGNEMQNETEFAE